MGRTIGWPTVVLVSVLLFKGRRFEEVVSVAQGISDNWRVFVKDPPIAVANSELVLELGVGLDLKLLREGMFAIITGRVVHQVVDPLWRRERPCHVQWWLRAGVSVRDGDGNFGLGHCRRVSYNRRNSKCMLRAIAVMMLWFSITCNQYASSLIVSINARTV